MRTITEDYVSFEIAKLLKKIMLFVFLFSLLSCTYDEIPAGKAIVTEVSVRNYENRRTYKIVLKPLEKMKWEQVRGVWNDTSGFIIYTDSLVCVGDTIDILK